ncbi:uncharacterized protein LOC131007151 [Salvia miltiorrhiza]|uniref:uncharacterized protein LOC131007151 n=1 Tax=Salvia miltiorrhiza TaxID=226208 RepID=UPI0025ABBE52|nr:uncharacterized protein LOC131007151 [Salvia miltiorrhiza]
MKREEFIGRVGGNFACIKARGAWASETLASYYPRDDLLLARNAHYPSFVWKSILVGRDLLAKGAAWKLGDGGRIRIGKDPWLPSGKGLFKVARVDEADKNRKAKELMDEDLSSWDLQKVEDLIEPRDRWRVTVQLRCNPSERDKPFWPGGKLNTYTVKSGYRLAMDLRQRDEASSSMAAGGLWKWIWGLEVIPKVKLFMWKCLANALPTAMLLRSRNVEIDPLCRRCGAHEETLEHALRDCAGVWSIVEWFEKIRSSPHPEVHAQFATIACSAWYARNLLFFQHKELSHIECLGVTSRAQQGSFQQHLPLKLECCREGQMKVSCDAALGADKGAGVGVVLWDSAGGLKSCRYGFVQGEFPVIEGEAMAILEGLHLCRERGITDAIFETDNQLLYWLLIKRENDLSYLGDTLRAIFEMGNLTTSLLVGLRGKGIP